MIYTVTLNPSVDYVVHMNKFVSGVTNRTKDEEYYIGGKGINVSYILAQLGMESTALGFTAGFTGEEIEKGLERMNIRSDFIRLENGMSRINIKIKAETESEINGQGPSVGREDMERLLSKIDRLCDGDVIVLAGSVPKNAGDDTYERILRRLQGKNIMTVVDTAGQSLLNCLSCRPFLIKPNLLELSDIFCMYEMNVQGVELCARRLMKNGAQNVLVSLGGNGALLCAADGRIYRSGTLKEKVLNTVGSGDSMVAGFIAGYLQQGDFGYALRLGTACGNATAFSKGLAEKEKIYDVLARL